MVCDRLQIELIVFAGALNAEAPFPLNFQLAMVHSTLVHGGAGERAVDPAVDVEATQLYPNIQFATVEECLDGLLL